MSKGPLSWATLMLCPLSLCALIIQPQIRVVIFRSIGRSGRDLERGYMSSGSLPGGTRGMSSRKSPWTSKRLSSKASLGQERGQGRELALVHWPTKHCQARLSPFVKVATL